MEIKKIENCNYVMFPRLQHCGLKPEHVNRDAFKAELKHVEVHGDYWLLHYLPNHLAKAREFQACLTCSIILPKLKIGKNIHLLPFFRF
jgi:hypothetical protein